MLREVGPIVPAGIEMKFVGDSARGEQIVKRLRAYVEAVFILGAAIEIDFKTRGARSGTRERERVVARPKSRVERRAE